MLFLDICYIFGEGKWFYLAMLAWFQEQFLGVPMSAHECPHSNTRCWDITSCHHFLQRALYNLCHLLWPSDFHRKRAPRPKRRVTWTAWTYKLFGSSSDHAIAIAFRGIWTSTWWKGTGKKKGNLPPCLPLESVKKEALKPVKNTKRLWPRKAPKKKTHFKRPS